MILLENIEAYLKNGIYCFNQNRLVEINLRKFNIEIIATFNNSFNIENYKDDIENTLFKDIKESTKLFPITDIEEIEKNYKEKPLYPDVILMLNEILKEHFFIRTIRININEVNADYTYKLISQIKYNSDNAYKITKHKDIFSLKKEENKETDSECFIINNYFNASGQMKLLINKNKIINDLDYASSILKKVSNQVEPFYKNIVSIIEIFMVKPIKSKVDF